MVEKAASQITDRSEEHSVGAGSGAFQEINAERAAFVNRQTEDAKAIKEGRARSFVTDQLGKVMLVNNEKPVGPVPEGGEGLHEPRTLNFDGREVPITNDRGFIPSVSEGGAGSLRGVEMPQAGGTDRSVRMPAADELIVQPLDVYFKLTAAEAAHGAVEFKSSAKAHARVAESRGVKESNAPHEADRGLVSTHRDKDGTRTYTYKDKTLETVSRDGKDRDVKYPDGSGYHLYPDGRKLIRHDDDTRDAYDPQGNIEWRQRKRPNGDYVYTNEKGQLKEYSDKNWEHHTTFAYDSEGKLERVSGDPPVGNWAREKRPDGTTYWQNVDDKSKQFDGEMIVDGDGNIRQTPHDPSADIRIFKHAGQSVETAKRTDPIESREYDPETGKLISWEENDGKEYARRNFDPKTGKMVSSDKVNSDGSSEHSEYAENGMRTNMKRSDGKLNKEEIIYDPKSGKEVATDIKFKDGSNMHVEFDADGNITDVSAKDKDGNTYEWKQGAASAGTVVKDVPNPEPLGGIGAKEIKFPNGFKVHLDFAPSSRHVTGIWTSDRDMQGVRDVHISHITRR